MTVRAPRSLLGCSRGVAAVEFALLAPFVALLLVGMLTWTQAMSASGKHVAATLTMSDLVTREEEVSDDDLADIATAARQVMYPLLENVDADALFGGRIVLVTFTGTSEAPVASIKWQYSFGDDPGDVPDINELLGLAEIGVDVVLVTTRYHHSLLFPGTWGDEVTMAERSVSRPRTRNTVRKV